MTPFIWVLTTLTFFFFYFPALMLNKMVVNGDEVGCAFLLGFVEIVLTLIFIAIRLDGVL